MAKYRDLIDRLDGPDRPTLRRALIDADGRAFAALAHALFRHPKASVREEVAEILGERKHWKAIPALIDALADECLFVRQDAIGSIEMICRFEPVGLRCLLNTSADLADAKALVLRWWKANRVFIERNENLC